MMYICKITYRYMLIDTKNKRISKVTHKDVLSVVTSRTEFYKQNRFNVKKGKIKDRQFNSEYEIMYSFSSVEEFQNQYPEIFL